MTHYQSALAIAQQIHSQALSSAQVTELMLNRIERYGHLRPYVTVTADIALQQAARADEEIRAGNVRSPLHGVPIAFKDLLATQGVVTTSGTTIYADHVPDHNATVVSRLLDAGTVMLGKLKLTEGAFSRHHPDVEIPVNPWNENYWTGVSSSGSGVATAAGLCYASLGTDTGGSIRFPAAANGIVGLKPTWGRVSRHGAFPLAYSLDHIGPMTRTVADAAAMLGIMAGYDALDPTSSRRPVPDYLSGDDFSVSGLRIGFDEAYVRGNTAAEHVAAVEQVLELLAGLGFEICPIRVDYQEVCRNWVITTGVEAAHAHAATFPRRRAEYGPIAGLLDLGLSVDAATYMQAELGRRSFMAALDGLFQDVDVILCPSMLLYKPPREGSSAMDEAESDLTETLKFTAPYDFSGNPTLSIPWPAATGEVPASFQLVGRHFDEGGLIRLGRLLEEQRGELAPALTS